MADADRVIVEHKQDGRQYSVPAKDPRATGEEAGWKVLGPETDESFVATGIPAPKRVRTRPRAKAAAPAPKPTAVEDDSEGEG